MSEKHFRNLSFLPYRSFHIESKFINDASFQVYVINKVLEQNNFWKIINVYFAYLNKEYIKNGPLDI